MIRVLDAYPYRQGSAGPEWLLLHRSQGRLYAGQWRMVGGKVESGETAWQAALREVTEETGLSIRRLWTLPSVNTFYDWEADRTIVAPAFAVEVQGHVRLDDEHDAAEYFSASEAMARLSWPEQRRLLELADEMLRSGSIPSELEIRSSSVGEQNA